MGASSMPCIKNRSPPSAQRYPCFLLSGHQEVICRVMFPKFTLPQNPSGFNHNEISWFHGFRKRLPPDSFA
jgi:hypothetical protein